MISRTAYCAHTEISCQLMHGVLFEAERSHFRCVATNGQRLAICTYDLELEESFESFSGVVPAKATALVKKIIVDDTDTIDVRLGSGHLIFRAPLGEISIRLIHGSFPPYKMGIPNCPTRVEIPRSEFIGLLRQASALKSKKTNFVGLIFSNKNKLTLKSVCKSVGETEIDYTLQHGLDNFSIAVNPEFLLQTFSVLTGKTVYFELGNEVTPTVIREITDAMESYCVYAVIRA